MPQLSLGLGFSERIIGFAILSVYLLVIGTPFFFSVYYKTLAEVGGHPSCPTNDERTGAQTDTPEIQEIPFSSDLKLLDAVATIVFVLASVNVATHAEVVLGMLDDVYAISIIVGVSFDVASQAMYLLLGGLATRAVLVDNREGGHFHLLSGDEEKVAGWWAEVATMVFLAVYVTALFANLFGHLRNLQNLFASYHRLQATLRSAWNNIKGDPGYHYRDHIHAYTDLGSHTFHMIVAWLAVGWEGGCRTLGRLATIAAVLYGLYLASHTAMTRARTDATALRDPIPSATHACLTVNGRGMPVCKCSACREEERAFVFELFGRWRMCELWFRSFRQLCDILDEVDVAANDRKRSGRKVIVENTQTSQAAQ